MADELTIHLSAREARAILRSVEFCELAFAHLRPTDDVPWESPRAIAAGKVASALERSDCDVWA